MAKLKSEQNADEFRQHLAYHEQQAAEHAARQEPDAAARHRTAAEAHRAAIEQPLNAKMAGMAFRASAIADEISQRVRRGRR